MLPVFARKQGRLLRVRVTTVVAVTVTVAAAVAVTVAVTATADAATVAGGTAVETSCGGSGRGCGSRCTPH